MGKPSKKKKETGLEIPYIHLSEDEPNDGHLYLHAMRHMARKDEQMADAFNLIKGKSELGARLLNSAKRHHVKFLRTTFDEASTRGLCEGDEVSLSKDNTFTEDVSLIPHELMHWRQPPMFMYGSWDIRSRLLASLAAEAGAETCTLKVAHQLRARGFPDAFHTKLTQDGWAGYSKMYKRFDKVLKKREKQNSETPELDATDAAYHAYFKQDDLVWSYGLDTLEEYLTEIAEDGNFYPMDGFSLKLAADMAKVKRGEYLVHRPVDLPLDDDVLFLDNPVLRQAFAYADAQHFLIFYEGDKSELAYQRRLKAMEDDDNPFIDLKLKKIIKAHSKKDAPDNIILTMLDMAECEPLDHAPQ